MVYKIPELVDDDFFEVEWRGTTYRLPLLQNISLDTLEEVSKVSDDPTKVDLENIRDVMRALDPEFGAIVGQFASKQLMAVFRALQDASSVSLGESEPSVESSSSTDQRSKPISSTEG